MFHSKRGQAYRLSVSHTVCRLIAYLVAGAVSGLLSLPLVVVAHGVSEFTVIGNGLRMLRE